MVLILLAVTAGDRVSAQDDPLMATCNVPVKAPFCQGMRGDRAEGW
jgi:hypothetical protein